nr:hypothetical protein 10 [bacterium]
MYLYNRYKPTIDGTMKTQDYLNYINAEVKDPEVKQRLIARVDTQEVRFVLYNRVKNFIKNQ